MELPLEFLLQTRSCLGEHETALLVRSLQSPPVTSIRVNKRKTEKVQNLTLPLERVPWSSQGYYLEKHEPFTFDPLWHAGAYYVQEPSSMFVEQALKMCLPHPMRVLDLCAAPGGKSTLLRSLLPNESLLVANEPIRSRTAILAENMARWGHPGVVVTASYPQAFSALPNFFDLILADVPCSGEGMFRKDEQAVREWSPENVMMCASRQREILQNVWPSLKDGGFLIYSTCTFNKDEDEENVAWICRHLGAECIPIPIERDWGAMEANSPCNGLKAYHFYPHHLKGEGFFLALLQKVTREKGSFPKKKKRYKLNYPSKKSLECCRDWFPESDTLLAFLCGENVRLLPKEHIEAVECLSDSLHVTMAGIEVAQTRGKELVPSPRLPLCNEIQLENLPSCELCYEEAIRFLQGKALFLPPDIPKGFIRVTFRGLGLGLVKNIGTRANNLYPAEWRIRSGYVPQEPHII